MIEVLLILLCIVFVVMVMAYATMQVLAMQVIFKVLSEMPTMVLNCTKDNETDS
jgi:hypothetical protein